MENNSILEIISRLSINKAVKIGLVSFGLIIAPYWIIFVFANDVYLKNNVIQNLLLSLGIGIPVCIMNYGLDLIVKTLDEKNDTLNISDDDLSSLASCCGLCGLSFYLPCIIQFFFGKISQHNAIIWIFSANAGFWASNIFQIIKYSIKGKSKLKYN